MSRWDIELRRLAMVYFTGLASTVVMIKLPILILGGAGKTGRRIASQLDARDVEFRLASRSSGQRFDWYDETTWQTAVRGADTAYLAPPVDLDGYAAAARFAAQAAEAGLRRLVLLSGRGVGSPGREFAIYDGQLGVEEAVRKSGLDWTILQPAWFMQNFSEGWARDYVVAGQLRLAAGSGDVATQVLVDQRHTGQTYALSGPRLLTMTQVAAELTEATGRPVGYVPLAPEDYVSEMVGYGVSRADAEALRDLFAVIGNHRSEYVSDGVQQVLRREPRDFTTWARSTAATGAWNA